MVQRAILHTEDFAKEDMAVGPELFDSELEKRDPTAVF